MLRKKCASSSSPLDYVRGSARPRLGFCQRTRSGRAVAVGGIDGTPRRRGHTVGAERLVRPRFEREQETGESYKSAETSQCVTDERETARGRSVLHTRVKPKDRHQEHEGTQQAYEDTSDE